MALLVLMAGFFVTDGVTMDECLFKVAGADISSCLNSVDDLVRVIGAVLVRLIRPAISPAV